MARRSPPYTLRALEPDALSLDREHRDSRLMTPTRYRRDT